jgi:asparagine synthase (glutamine-hydrolysing)
MCGIAGMVCRDDSLPDKGLLQRMTAAVAHRGPDGEGMWMAPGVGLGHRRLAIVDLSPTGRQPMHSPDGRYAMSYNGEVYNFRELRAELERAGISFRSASDTEVIIAAYRAWGRACVERFSGMFAFALWDAERRELFFARDRIGKKPFFYRTLTNGCFAFASEMKALTPLEPVTRDDGAIRLFAGLQYVPSPRTGFTEIHSLPPGHRGVVRHGDLHIERYNDWEALRVKQTSSPDNEIRSRLEEAVRLRLLADVPVGAFLSGGVDSAIVVALASRHVERPLRTYTMGFAEIGMDERAEAREIAQAFGTDHQEFEATPGHLTLTAERVIAQYDAPYADSSALPLMLLAEQTAEQVKAVLTGDGGDELFGGYRRYSWFDRAACLRQLGIAAPAQIVAQAAWHVVHDPRAKRFAYTLQGIRQAYGRGYAELFTSAYFSSADLSIFQPDFLARTHKDDAATWMTSQYPEQARAAGALQFDLQSYLPDDLNVKMDRATMAHGLEARSPFLDQQVVALALGMSLREKVRGAQTKIALKRAFAHLVPADVLRRKKKGFQVPLGAWFRGPLKDYWRERCLDPQGSLGQYVRLQEAERLFEENIRGIDHGNRLWMLLSLSLWLERA